MALIISKKYYRIKDYIYLIESILLVEYSLQVSQIQIYAYCLSLALLLRFYEAHIDQKCKKYCKMLILHLMYLFVRFFLDQQSISLPNSIQVVVLIGVIYIKIVLSYPLSYENANDNQKLIYRYMDRSIQEPLSADFQRNNDQEKENRNCNIDKQSQSGKKLVSAINMNENQIEKEQIKEGDINSSILFDYTKIQSTGFLVLNDQNQILKYNNQFSSLIQQLQSYNQELFTDSTNLNSSDQFNLLFKSFFHLNLKYNLIQINNTQEIKKLQESKYKENQKLTLVQNFKIDQPNIQSDNLKISQQEHRLSIQSDVKDLSQQHYSIQNLINTSLEEGLSNLNNKLSSVQDKQKQSHQQNDQIQNNFNLKCRGNKEEDLEIQLEINKNHLKQKELPNNSFNFLKDLNNQNSDKENTLSNQQLLQCSIPNNINQFFEQKQIEVNLQNLLKFLREQQPKEKHSKQQKCKKCSKVFDKIHEKHNNQNKKAQNLQFQTYKYSIQQDYLTISLKFYDKKNSKRNFDIKIGCFKTQNNQNLQKNLDFFCENCNRKSINELQEVDEQSENQKDSTFYNFLQSRSFLEQKAEKSLKNSNKQGYLNQDSTETNSCNNNNFSNYVKQIKLIGLNSQLKEGPQYQPDTKQNQKNGINLEPNTNDSSKYFIMNGIQILENSQTLFRQDHIQNINEQTFNIQNQQDDSYVFTIEIFETNFEVTTRSLKQRMEKFKRKMLSSISHELRTPLNCIISMLDILNMNNDISDLNKTLYVNPALFSSYILLNIINDILDLAEINRSGQIKMIFQEFSPLNLCIECLNFIKLQASQKNLQLELICEESVPQIVYTDLDKTRQVLLNLLSNALKFTQKGSVVIRLSYPQDQTIQIDVKDTGCGIPASKLRQIFKNFIQPDLESINSAQKQNSPTLKRQQSSTFQKNAGLGLSISYMLASCLGDNRQLTVKSEVGKGSIFSFFVVNKPNQKKGCILYPQNKFESQASLKTKFWVEKGDNFELQNLSALNQKKNNDKQTETWKQNLDEDQITFPNKDQTTYQNFGSENQSQTQGTQNKNKKKLTNPNLGSLQNISIMRQQNKKSTIETQQEYNDSNTFQELLPINDIQRQDSLKVRKPSFLYNNFSKTTMQIIQHASSLQSYVFSAKEINDDQSQPITQKGIYLNTNNTLISNNEQTSQLKYIIQSNQNNYDLSTNSNQNLEIKPIRIKESETFSKQNQLNIFSPLLKVRQGKKQSNLSIQFNFDFNEESPRHQSSKTLNIPSYDESFNTFTKSPQKKILIQQLESCNVLNDSFDIKSPQQFTPHVERFRQRQSSQQSYHKNTPQNLHQSNVNSKFNEEQQFHNIQISQNQQNLLTSIEKNSNLNTAKLPQDNIFDQQNHVDVSNYCCSITNRSKASTFQIEKIEEIIQNQQNQQKQCQCNQILLVDDNEFNLYALEARLRIYSFQTDKTTSGYQALELIRKKSENSCCKKYHLIFMDIDMPEMNGYQATQEIIKLHQKLKISRPLISACTAYVQEDDKIKAYNSGMDFYITKPINISALENVLTQVFPYLK